MLAQTAKNFEVLLIDDGSTDGSGKLCEEYAAQDARIRVLHKENGGQGTARDMGLDHAQGEYICYLDSDDEMLPALRGAHTYEEFWKNFRKAKYESVP